jgi:hypothetical protein
MARKVLLVCGILSSLLYVATDILGAMRFEGYSYTSQSISELMAVGAPSTENCANPSRGWPEIFVKSPPA